MTTLPVAAGERHAGVAATMELIEKEIVDVVQPDMGRAGGLTQMKRIAAMAEVRAAFVSASQLCVSILLCVISIAGALHHVRPARREPGTSRGDGQSPALRHPP